jgi:hypothetical protein
MTPRSFSEPKAVPFCPTGRQPTINNHPTATQVKISESQPITNPTLVNPQTGEDAHCGNKESQM